MHTGAIPCMRVRGQRRAPPRKRSSSTGSKSKKGIRGGKEKGDDNGIQLRSSTEEANAHRRVQWSPWSKDKPAARAHLTLFQWSYMQTGGLSNGQWMRSMESQTRGLLKEESVLVRGASLTPFPETFGGVTC